MLSTLFGLSRTWSSTPEVTVIGDSECEVGVVFFDGAFSSGWERIAKYVDLFTRVGCLYIPEYGHEAFDPDLVIKTVYSRVREAKHKRLLLVGLSMGGKLSLQFIDYDAIQSIPRYTGRISIIAASSPLGKEHLTASARYARKIHPGRVTNLLLSSVVTHLMFRPMKQARLSPGTSRSDVRRYVATMRCFKVSAIVAHIAAIVKPVEFRFVRDIPTVYLHCDDDKVIKGNAARMSWEGELGLDLRGVISVASEHVALVEHFSEWFAAFVEAIRLLGFTTR